MKISAGVLRNVIRKTIAEARWNAAPQLHRLRNGAKFSAEDTVLIADTKTDPEWVILMNAATNEPVARQAKQSSGRVFAQGSNPDREGRESYRLDYYRDGEWSLYDSQARAGAIKDPNFLNRVLKPRY